MSVKILNHPGHTVVIQGSFLCQQKVFSLHIENYLGYTVYNLLPQSAILSLRLALKYKTSDI